MSSSQHVHATTRHSPPHVRKTARSAPSSKSAGTSKATIKGAKATKRDKGEDEEIFEDDNEDMGSSFLQFCAMCEKQIVVPNSLILYCSESCRHRDSIMPPTHPYPTLAPQQSQQNDALHPLPPTSTIPSDPASLPTSPARNVHRAPSTTTGYPP
ncbi:hypothetical protein ABVK25_007304 [Lepraria finkii]|uniref:Uncharacterized protein n=1 Tax=Lepraria finkii TaxID=1340010 RepID=A0ABR4B3E8_9LECA